ncbi:MAG: hypothetical protein OEV24_08505 [Cyclobacteriaceae bacterium]|nr:hypothetical protein [Cyclobacteriaceae bacterium]
MKPLCQRIAKQEEWLANCKTGMKIWLAVLFIFQLEQTIGQQFIQTALKQGPYKVGFKAGIHYDMGRPPLQEQFMRFRQGRGVHISVWYPATVKANHPNMMFSGYVDEISRMVNPREVTKRTRTESIHRMNVELSRAGGDSIVMLSHLAELLNANTHAFRNASYIEGSFPILVYPESPHFNNILIEYLASYGYVVVSVSRHGTFTEDFNGQHVSEIETAVQDCQFALSVIKKEFKASGQPMAVVGTGISALTGLAWMMRDPSIEALVSIDGAILNSLEYELIKKSPYFDINHSTKPMLVMHSPQASANPDLINNYRYADRYLLSLPHLRELYYLNLGAWEKMMPGILGPSPGDASVGFEWLALYTLYFLDWKLKQGYHGRRFFEETPVQNGVPSGLMEYYFIPGKEVPSTEKELIAIKN